MSDATAAAPLLERPLTYDEERGKPMPSFNHSVVQANLIVAFAKFRHYRVCSELALELGGQYYTPDLSLYPREPADFRHDLIRRQDPPLLAVEIYSPTQGSQEIMEKVDVYLRQGVKSCWIVSPSICNITIMTPDGKRHPFSAGIATDPVLGVTADLDEVFS